MISEFCARFGKFRSTVNQMKRDSVLQRACLLFAPQGYLLPRWMWFEIPQIWHQPNLYNQFTWLLLTSASAPILLVVKEMCSSLSRISNSCRPTLSGSGHFESSSWNKWAYTTIRTSKPNLHDFRVLDNSLQFLQHSRGDCRLNLIKYSKRPILINSNKTEFRLSF